MAAPYSDQLVPTWEENVGEVLENELKISLVVGLEDPQLDSMVFLGESLDSIKIPHQFKLLTGVGHSVGEIYNQVGIEGLQFHTECFRNAKPIYQHPIFIPGVFNHNIPF